MFADGIHKICPLMAERIVMLFSSAQMKLQSEHRRILCLLKKKASIVTYNWRTRLLYFAFIIGRLYTEKNQYQILGCLWDTNGLFPQHIDSVVSKARRHLGLIKWIERFFRNVVFSVTLYKSLYRFSNSSFFDLPHSFCGVGELDN